MNLGLVDLLNLNQWFAIAVPRGSAIGFIENSSLFINWNKGYFNEPVRYWYLIFLPILKYEIIYIYSLLILFFIKDYTISTDCNSKKLIHLQYLQYRYTVQLLYFQSKLDKNDLKNLPKFM